MNYNYRFDKEGCWYKNSCKSYNTIRCSSSCFRYMEIDFLMFESNIPKNRQKGLILKPDRCDIHAFKELQHIKDCIVDFISQSKNLYIYSNNFGNGKTTWAIKIMLKFFDEIWAGNGFRPRGLFVHVPTFLVDLKENIRKEKKEFSEFLEKLNNVDLVIWDDIASTKLSEYDHCNLLTYIDKRLLNGLSNIYTGNIDKAELPDAIGQRLTSRIYNESIVIKLLGKDKRNNDSFTSSK
jgi:DNA replication protein DnaC